MVAAHTRRSAAGSAAWVQSDRLQGRFTTRRSATRRHSGQRRTSPPAVRIQSGPAHTLLKTLARNEIERNTAMATHVNRFVFAPDAQNRAAVLERGLTNVQSREGFYWRATLWATQETPVDNTI